MATRITRDELEAQMDRGEDIVIIEALPSRYYQDVHLPGALNLPYDQVDELAPRLLPDQDQEVIVYCSNHTCQNSTIAANRLTQLGYTKVREYEEGKQDWLEAGLPVERGAQPISVRQPRPQGTREVSRPGRFRAVPARSESGA